MLRQSDSTTLILVEMTFNDGSPVAGTTDGLLAVVGHTLSGKLTYSGGSEAIDTARVVLSGVDAFGNPVTDNLWVVTIRPEADLYSIIKADQQNGVVLEVMTSKCNLADEGGNDIPNNGCGNSALTIRWLEGDVSGDCIVNAIDQQLLAFRWGAELGDLFYNQAYDLVDTGSANIDVKDVQFVFGRHGSDCGPTKADPNRTGAPNPDQFPVNPKASS